MALKIYNPPTPYLGEIEGCLQNGMQIQIAGMPSEEKNAFTIDLKSGDSILFHFNPRFDENQVVRNTFHGGNWGAEERQGNFPFQKDCYFNLVIYAQQTCFRVFIDGQYYCDYNHRLPMNTISHIETNQGLTLNYIIIDYPMPHGYPSVGDLAPVFNPPTPLLHNIGPLYPNRLICISAIPNPNANRFTVDFRFGADIAFHFDVRYSENAIVRNTCRNGGWETEERDAPYFPFQPNLFFEMIILVDPCCFKVAVNNQHFIAYNHRVQPIQCIDTIEIKGDVKICQVRFK